MKALSQPVFRSLGRLRCCRVCLTRWEDHINVQGQPLPCWKVFRPYVTSLRGKETWPC